MKTVIKNHLNELQVSTARMLLYHSDNKMLISYFKDLSEKLVYLKELTEIESKYDWEQIEIFIEGLIKQDPELTHVNINYQIKDVIDFKKEALLKVKQI